MAEPFTMSAIKLPKLPSPPAGSSAWTGEFRRLPGTFPPAFNDFAGGIFALPEAGRIFPDSFHGFPESFCGFPKPFRGFAKSLDALAERFREFAESFDGFPEPFRGFAESFLEPEKSFRESEKSFDGFAESFREPAEWPGNPAFSQKPPKNASYHPFPFP